MRENHRRARIVTGTFTLPVVAALTAILWVLPDAGNVALWAGLAVTAVTTYLLMECSNRNALLRVRSRMISVTYLMLMMTCPFLHQWDWDMLPMFCWLASYAAFFKSYQNMRPEGCTFYGFLFVGLASMVWMPLLLAAPLFYASLLLHMRSLTWKSLCSGILGLLLPYWFVTGYAVWTGSIQEVSAMWQAQFAFLPADYSQLTGQQVSAFVVLAVLGLPATIHYLRTAYNDKIRTRMFFYMIIMQELAMVLACALQPQHAGVLLPLLIVNSAPLIAHHLSLSRGRWANTWFFFSLMLVVCLLVFNHLDLWRIFWNF